MPIASGLNILL